MCVKVEIKEGVCMNPNAITASRLKQLREEKGLSQEQFAEEFSEFVGRKNTYSVMTLSNWETGRKLPPTDTIVQLSMFYGATTDYILGLSNDSSKVRGADNVVSISQRVEVPFADLSKHNGEALYVKFPDDKIESQMGLIDFPNKQLITIRYKLQLNQKCRYFLCVPPEELTIKSQMNHLLNLKDVKAMDKVYIQSLSPDPYIQGSVTGWYSNDVSGKFLINEAGRTLSYEGLGINYNALNFKVPTKKANTKKAN